MSFMTSYLVVRDVSVAILVATLMARATQETNVTGPVRLVSVGSTRRGRLEIFHSNEWGSVCNDRFGIHEASAACRQLGFVDGGQVLTDGTFGPGSGPIWADNVHCAPGARNLSQCTSLGWRRHNCRHEEDVGVVCGPLLTGSVRLVNGMSRRSGRLEILHDDQWGTVCDGGFDSTEASAACRQLGFQDGSAVHGVAHFGKGSGLIWAEDVDCPPGAPDLSQCSSRGWGAHYCNHSQDVGVSCSGSGRLLSGSIRLVPGPRSGRLEVFHNSEWGTVCGRGFGSEEASTACRQLGFPDGTVACTEARASDGGSHHIWAEGVQCPPGATHVAQCSFRGWGVHSCSHRQDVGLHCSPSLTGSVRLVGGPSNSSGRLEILHSDQWGTVCGDNFEKNEASAVCRQLGYLDGGVARSGSRFGEGSGPIWADDVRCPPGATGLSQCTSNVWGIHNCQHGDDIGVICHGLWTEVTVVPEVIHDLPCSRSVGIGRNLTVSCSFEAFPEAAIVWTYGGSTALPAAVTVVSGTHTTPDGRVTSSHLEWSPSAGDAQRRLASGVYQCEATNEIGSSMSSSMTLDVQYGPYDVTVNVSSPVTLAEGEGLVLEGQADCSPPCQFAWSMGGVTMTTTDGPLLQTDRIRCDQSGNWTVMARNTVGSLIAGVEVIVTCRVVDPVADPDPVTSPQDRLYSLVATVVALGTDFILRILV